MASPDALQNPRVVIIGAGFGGLSAIKRLAESHCRIRLIDRHNYHLFQPLLYQVATAALSPADIASPRCLGDAVQKHYCWRLFY
jgi:NADH:ubiquinone reductase (H+-translocating)